MSLLEDITAERRRPGGKCSIPIALRALPPDEAAQLVEAIDCKNAAGEYLYQATDISRALAKQTPRVDLSAFPINRHRRGDCQCR